MVKIKPQSLDQMLDISGIGQAKIDRYGQVFLDIILQDYLDKD